jgi:hypothetical protein
MSLQNQEELVTFDTVPNLKKQHQVHVGAYLLTFFEYEFSFVQLFSFKMKILADTQNK